MSTNLVIEQADAISCHESRDWSAHALDESPDRRGILLSWGSFRNEPSKQRNWEFSNRTERQRRSAGARGEVESSTRARLLITGTAAKRVGERPENTGKERERRTKREREKERERKEGRKEERGRERTGATSTSSRTRGPSVRVLGVCSPGRRVALNSFKVGKSRKEEETSSGRWQDASDSYRTRIRKTAVQDRHENRPRCRSTADSLRASSVTITIQ